MDTTVPALRFFAFSRTTSEVTHYLRFEIPKKTGDTRRVSAPMPRLKQAQHWLLEHILDKVALHDASHGFRKQRSIVSNARPHVGADVANGVRRLPQGTPNSPAITNVVCRRMDAAPAGPRPSSTSPTPATPTTSRSAAPDPPTPARCWTGSGSSPPPRASPSTPRRRACCATAVARGRRSRRRRSGGRCSEADASVVGQRLFAAARSRSRTGLHLHRQPPRLKDLSYTIGMSRVYSARVRGGVVVPDGVTFPDGTAVTIAVNDEREAEVELTPAELDELDDAIADADRSESVSSAVVLAELDRIARTRR